MPGETAVVAITAPSIGRTDVGLAVSSRRGPRRPSGAILAGAHQQGLAWTPGAELDAIPGVGVEATVAGQRLFLGRADGRIALTGQVAERLATLEAAGKTTVVLADVDGERPLGRPLELLAVADQLRPEATGTVADLHALGLRVAMLSDDHDRVANAIARQASIDDWHANLLPEHKTSAIEELRHAHGPVAMVGDGVNDAPALASAELLFQVLTEREEKASMAIASNESFGG